MALGKVRLRAKVIKDKKQDPVAEYVQVLKADKCLYKDVYRREDSIIFSVKILLLSMLKS